jgi:hypothetical protein
MATLSEMRRIEPAKEQALISQGPKFLRDSHIGFVVVDRNRATNDLTRFAIRALSLRRSTETHSSISTRWAPTCGNLSLSSLQCP